MELNENIAKIDFESKTPSLKHITLHFKNLKFKCKRCAIFCCKLGGPTLSTRDYERLKNAGLCDTDFLDNTQNRLKSKTNGSCIYLGFNPEKRVYSCAIYDLRPELCRIYPFCFKKTNSNFAILKIMPCMGINYHYGEPIDEKLITSYLAHWINHISEDKFY